MSRLALENVKVADFTWVAAGPVITSTLAAYGASVIRIESNKRPDFLRSSAEHKDGKLMVDSSGSFAYLNVNKYSIALNLAHPKGVEVARRLVAWSDVVVENFSPGVMERWGLGYEDLRRIKPDIIMLRSSNQGQRGPLANHPGYGLQLMAFSGLVHLVGWTDRGPVPLPIAYTDFVSPRFGAVAVIAALNYRRKTGKGQLLDLSQLEAGLHFLAPQILNCVVNNEDSNRMGNSCPYAAPHGIYRCKGDERWCAIAVFTDAEWNAFCQVMGKPAWTKDARFSTLLGRKKNEDELNRLVEEWTIDFTPEEVMSLMQAVGVSAGVVASVKDLHEDPQLQLRDHSWVLKHRVLGLFPHRGQASKLSKTPAQPRMPAPCLGEHTEYVCTKLLGMSKKEFTDLLGQGVFD